MIKKITLCALCLVLAFSMCVSAEETSAQPDTAVVQEETVPQGRGGGRGEMGGGMRAAPTGEGMQLPEMPNGENAQGVAMQPPEMPNADVSAGDNTDGETENHPAGGRRYGR